MWFSEGLENTPFTTELIIIFPDLVDEYQQYQDATADDDEDDEEEEYEQDGDY